MPLGSRNVRRIWPTVLLCMDTVPVGQDSPREPAVSASLTDLVPALRFPCRAATPRARSGGRLVAMATKRDARLVSLGYGRFVKADRVFALVPLEASERGDGRRTYVHVEGLAEPIVASRSERAILADVEAALAEAAGVPARKRGVAKGQDALL